EEIGASAIPQLVVYNKIDRLESCPRIDRDPDGRAVAVWISAEQRVGLELLREAVAERLAPFSPRARLNVPARARAQRPRRYGAHAVRAESAGSDGSIELAVELPALELLALARTAGVQILEVQGAGAPCAPANTYLQSSAISHAGKLR